MHRPSPQGPLSKVFTLGPLQSSVIKVLALFQCCVVYVIDGLNAVVNGLCYISCVVAAYSLGCL